MGQPDEVCEREVSIATAYGTMNAWRFAAETRGGGPLPAVVVLMDAPGIRPALHDLSRRIASNGYLVLLPNLYYRVGREVQVGPTRAHPDAERNRDQMIKLIQTLGNDMVVRDVRYTLDYLRGDSVWNGEPVGLTGYCMSGRFAVMSAARMPDRVACAASYFGTRLITDEPTSPHLEVAKVRGELYFSFAEIDHYVPLTMVERLSSHLKSAGVRHQVEVYPGTEHGFVFPDRGSFLPEGAERHWSTLLALLQRNLKETR